MTTLADVPVPDVKRYRLTVDEYHAMGEAGIFHEDDRVELIDGQIIIMSPINDPHVACVIRLDKLLHRRILQHLETELFVSVQNPVRLGAHDMPEPDLVITTAASRAPRAADVLLLIEVADSSLTYDRDVKLPRYAAAGIPEVWIVDLRAEQIEVYREPFGEQYRVRVLAGRDDTVDVAALPDVEPLAVADVLGAPPA